MSDVEPIGELSASTDKKVSPVHVAKEGSENIGIEQSRPDGLWDDRASLLSNIPLLHDEEVEQYMAMHSETGVNGNLPGGHTHDLPGATSDLVLPVSNQSLETFLEELESENSNSNFQELLAAHLSEMRHALVTRIDSLQLLVNRRLAGGGSAKPDGPVRFNGVVKASSSVVSKKLSVESASLELDGQSSWAQRPPPPDTLARSSIGGDEHRAPPPAASTGTMVVSAPVRSPPALTADECESYRAEMSSDAESSEAGPAKPSSKAGKCRTAARVSYEAGEDEDTRVERRQSSKEKDGRKSTNSQDFGTSMSMKSAVTFKDDDQLSETSSLPSREPKTPEPKTSKGFTKVNSLGSLGSGESFVFELLPVWRRQSKKHLINAMQIAQERGNSRMQWSSVQPPEQDQLEVQSTAPSVSEPRKRPFWRRHQAVLPNSPVRGIWDCMSCFLVFYDMVMIPLELLEPEDIPFALGMSWVTRIFWTLDMPASLCTGFVKPDGVVERRYHKVLRRYLKTWFLFDTFMILLEWLELMWSASSSMGFLRFGRTSRAFRIIRMVRLLRLIRIREILVMIAERVRSERLIIAADIIKIMLVVVSFAHVIACIWYGIGNSESAELTWVREFDIQNASLGHKYASSMHWSLSQFSGGMDEIRPANTEERVFTIFAFLFAFLMASTLVSRLTSSMTRLHMLSNTQAQQLVALRKYLSENGINQSVAIRIQKNAQHAIAEQQRFMPESKVELLRIVSEPLLMELHFELYHSVIGLHPFFGRYIEECGHVMRKVCHLAVSMMQVGLGDIIFNTGEIPSDPKMYFVSSGMMLYESPFEADLTVSQGQWVAEMTLWTQWMHRGTLSCTGNCRLSVLDSSKFQDIAGRFEHPPTFEPRLYAGHFVRELNSIEGEITDLTMVHFPLSMVRRRASRMGDVQEVGPNTVLKFLGYLMDQSKGGGAGATTMNLSGAPARLARSFTQKENLGKILPCEQEAQRKSLETLTSEQS